MATDDVDLDNQSLQTKKTFGRCVHDSLLARYGQPVLPNYQDIQKLKSSDRQTTITLLYGAEAAASDRYRHILPDELVEEIAEHVENSQRIMHIQGKTEGKLSVLSGLLEILVNTLIGLG